MSIWAILIIGIIAALIGFIILQRRRPDTADKIASSLDAGAKSVEQQAKDAADNLLKK
jgi:hypothetical protein